MSRTEDFNKHPSEQTQSTANHNQTSNRLFEDAYNISQGLQGVGEGFTQACREGIHAVTHPVSLAKSIIDSMETAVGTAQALAKRVSAGESGMVIKEMGKALERAGNDYLKMTPKEQGRVIGHDVLPPIVAELPMFFRGAKVAEATSKILNTAGKQVGKEVEKKVGNEIEKEAAEKTSAK